MLALIVLLSIRIYAQDLPPSNSSIEPSIALNTTNTTIGPKKCTNKFTDPGLPILCCNKRPLVSRDVVKNCSKLLGNVSMDGMTHKLQRIKGQLGVGFCVKAL